LERLLLARSTFADEQLARLPLPNLKFLDLSRTPLADGGVEHVRSLKRLEYLDLSRTAVTQAGLAALQTLTNLQTVVLDETGASDASIAYLAKLPKLRVVSLNNTAIGDAALEHLRDVTSLRELRLNGTRVTDAGLVSLQGLSNLVTLELRDTRITDAGIEAIESLRDMKALMLGGTRITDASAAKISRWTDLTTLDVSGTLITDVGVERLSELKKLVWLDLEVAQVTDAALPLLSRMNKLEVLNLADTPITDKGLGDLKPLVALRMLNLSGTQISDPRLEAIRHLPSLMSVDVHRTTVTALDVFRAMPRTNPNVQRILAALGQKTELDFTQQPLSDIIDYLKQRHDIEIQLDHKSVFDAGVAYNTPITSNLARITLREALQEMLDPLKLTFAIRHEVLLIAAKPLPEIVADFPLVPAGERLSPKVAETVMQRSELDFADRPLRDVIALLARKHKIPIELDAKSLADAGIGFDVPISRWVKGITLKSALELLLADLDLICVAEGEMLIIRSKPAQ
jgi:Leucine-rich repeat (LRR) protein